MITQNFRSNGMCDTCAHSKICSKKDYFKDLIERASKLDDDSDKIFAVKCECKEWLAFDPKPTTTTAMQKKKEIMLMVFDKK